MYEKNFGAFPGRMLIQRSGHLGGSKAVFVKMGENGNDMVYPTIGGMIKNPPRGRGFKMFAGDLCWFKTDDNGENPEIYLLKTYLVESVSEDGKTVGIVRDGYKHIPFVGDKLGVAPAAVGGTMTVSGTVTAVTETTESNVKVWSLTLDTALTGAKKGDILVEVGDGKMLVEKINAVIDCDCDLAEVGSYSATDFNDARYNYTPSLKGTMYINKMSPMPACVKALNKSEINGWFRVDGTHK